MKKPTINEAGTQETTAWQNVMAWFPTLSDTTGSRKYSLYIAVIGIFFATNLQPVFAATEASASPKVFMYVTDGSRDLDLMLNEEVGVMLTMLEDAGFSVDIATSDGQDMRAATTTLMPTIHLADVDIDNYAGVILPCMAPAPGTESHSAIVDQLLREALELGKPIAAARGAVATLAAAGGISGREYAFASAVDTTKRPAFEGGTFLGIGVVRDDTITTSGICPLAAKSLNEQDGTVELTENFIASLADAG